MLCCLGAQAWAAPRAANPAGEWVRWHGRSYLLTEQPLADRIPDLRSAAHFVAPPGDGAPATRGYVALWQLDDDRLYLHDIQAWRCAESSLPSRCTPLTLRDLFGPVASAPLLADWFSGELHLRLDRESCGPGDDCASLPGNVRLTLKAGKLMRIENTMEATPAAASSRR